MDISTAPEETTYPDTLRPTQHAIYDAALNALKGTSEGAGKALKEIIPTIQEALNEDYSEAYIYRVLRKASQSDQSPIQSGGPWGGYFLNREKVVTEEERAAPPQDEPVQVGEATLYEKHLYPLVSFWMKYKKEYELVSDEVARFRAGGIWSNPDVVAFDVTDRLGFFDVEVVSAEVKSSEKNWRQWIFEAVSHRRFVDRSYFIFRSENGARSLDQEILVYAEKFRVGVCVIDLPNERVQSLINWGELSNPERIEFAESVVEVFPAPREAVSVKDKCEFLENMRIVHKDELYRFGNK